jgi:hypothetical protein
MQRFTARGTPILEANDPKVREVAKMISELLGAMVDLDRSSVVATDVLYAMFHDTLWVRDSTYGASDPKLSEAEREDRILKAKQQILDEERFSHYQERYVSHVER